MTPEEKLEEMFPWINFREPVDVTVLGRETGMACRFCIGQFGLKGSEFRPFKSRQEFDSHMLNVHGIAPL